jgi:hypothetical protein
MMRAGCDKQVFAGCAPISEGSAAVSENQMHSEICSQLSKEKLYVHIWQEKTLVGGAGSYTRK